MYGKKYNIPLFYEYFYTHRNNYSSKSEKSRHEILLNEISKLKFYLQQNPNEELLILKDFLQKYNIKNISDYSEEKLLYICKLICKSKQNILLNIIKPDSTMKKMIYNLLNISFEIKEKEKEKNKNNNTIYYPRNDFRKIYLNKNNKSETLYQFRVNNRKKLLNVYETNNLKYIDKQKELYRPNKNYSDNFNLLLMRSEKI